MPHPPTLPHNTLNSTLTQPEWYFPKQKLVWSKDHLKAKSGQGLFASSF